MVRESERVREIYVKPAGKKGKFNNGNGKASLFYVFEPSVCWEITFCMAGDDKQNKVAAVFSYRFAMGEMREDKETLLKWYLSFLENLLCYTKLQNVIVSSQDDVL